MCVGDRRDTLCWGIHSTGRYCGLFSCNDDNADSVFRNTTVDIQIPRSQVFEQCERRYETRNNQFRYVHHTQVCVIRF